MRKKLIVDRGGRVRKGKNFVNLVRFVQFFELLLQGIIFCNKKS